MKLERAELWTDFSAASGIAKAMLPRFDVKSAERRQDLDGADELTIGIARTTSVWSEVVERRVIRITYDKPLIRQPDEISGLVAWYDASKITGLSDGDPVSQWDDESGGGNNGTQGTGSKQPTYRENQQNGQPGVEFDSASSQELDIPNFMSGASEGTLFVVARVKNDPPLASGDAGHPIVVGAPQNANWPWTDSNIYEIFGTSSTDRLVVDPGPSLESFHIYVVKGDATEQKVWLDGTVLASDSTNTVDFEGPRSHIGQSGGGNFFDGFILEIAAFNRALTAAEREQLQTYLSDKYGIAIPDHTIARTVTEHRLTRPIQERDQSGDRRAVLRAHGPLRDLREYPIVRTEANGVLTLGYTLLSFSHDDLMDHILGFGPSWITKGTVDRPDTEVEAIVFDVDSVLSGLQQLVQITGMELGVRRNGESGYFIDLLERRNSDAEKPYLMFGKNTKGLRREGPDTSDLANRLWPAGAGEGRVRMSIGKARWLAATVSGQDVTVSGNPILEDDALNDLYVENIRTGALWQIQDSVHSTQIVTLPVGHDVEQDDLIAFRLNAAGDELGYVEDPSSVAAYGVVADTFKQDDLPLVENLVRNPALRRWDAGLLRDWEIIGTAVSRETDPVYTDHGGSSAKYSGNVEGDGLRTDPIEITPTSDSPFFSGFIMVWNESEGGVEFVIEYRIPSSSTFVTDGWSASQNAAAPESGDVVLSADGAEAFSNLEDATAVKTTYRVFYDVDTTGMVASVTSPSLRVELYKNDAAGSTTWKKVAEKSYAHNLTLTDEMLEFAAALGPDFDLRLTVVVLTSGTFSVTAHGEDNVQPGVEYQAVSAAEWKASAAAFTNETDRFILLEIAGLRLPLNADRARLVVTARSQDSNPWWLDAAQLTQTGTNAPFFEGRSPNVLWRRALDELRKRAAPRLRYEVDVLDLTTIDRSKWPYDEFVIGGDVVVSDDELGVVDTVRVIDIRRDILTGETTRIDLEEILGKVPVGLLGAAPEIVEATG